ncbi:Hypothetical predicted protein [Paramuricea clavata]|uniref:Uncharacterized protein n=1 Tax=Paramuricea clavata TaxID=317549 RepID=A0A6S7JGJ9_PARCT|nr:Hypothetical predicted protein [Paramuricea clavata]
MSVGLRLNEGSKLVQGEVDELQSFRQFVVDVVAYASKLYHTNAERHDFIIRIECQGENGDSEDEISIRETSSEQWSCRKAVQAVKRLMKNAKKDNADVYLAVLDYRNTPTQGSESSPAQRLMSRRTKTLLPTTAKFFAQRVVENHHQEIVKGQERQGKYYNRGAKDLPRLKKEDKVRI